MNINTHEISKHVTLEYCQVPLLKENPSIIQDVKKYIDILISKISIELKKENKTLKQFLDDENAFENIDIEDILYNSRVKRQISRHNIYRSEPLEYP